MEQKGDITIETERGEVIDSIGIRISEFTGAIYRNYGKGELTQTRCLQFIDPYGDTTFNMLQKRILVNELKSLSSSLGDPMTRDYLGRVIDFLSKYQDDVHIYVKFHGD